MGWGGAGLPGTALARVVAATVQRPPRVRVASWLVLAPWVVPQVLIAAHGNSLRALVKHLDGVSDDDIAELNIPTGIPLVYRLDATFKPIVAGGEYLDPEAAAAGAAAVAAQGKK